MKQKQNFSFESLKKQAKEIRIEIENGEWKALIFLFEEFHHIEIIRNSSKSFSCFSVNDFSRNHLLTDSIKTCFSFLSEELFYSSLV